jgi:hypothetical protein
VGLGSYAHPVKRVTIVLRDDVHRVLRESVAALPGRHDQA